MITSIKKKLIREECSRKSGTHFERNAKNIRGKCKESRFISKLESISFRSIQL